MGAADFMGLTDAETEYLLLLVEYARAGSHKLANFLEAKIRKQQKDKTTLKERFADAKAIPINDQHEYYSAWYYSAIHILLAIPGFSDPTKIAHRLHLPIEIVHRVIEYLLRIGLVVRGRDGFEFTENRLYLDRDSVFIQRHHINWRSQSSYKGYSKSRGEIRGSSDESADTKCFIDRVSILHSKRNYY